VQRTLKIIGSQLHGIRTSSIRALEILPDGLAVTLVSSTRFGDDQSTTDAQISDNPLCVLYPARTGLHDADDSASGSCYTTAEIRAGRAHAASRGSDGAMHAHGLVPDEVSTVTAQFHDGRTVSARVRNNLFDIRLGSSKFAAGDKSPAVQFPVSYRWTNASGRDVSPASHDSG